LRRAALSGAGAKPEANPVVAHEGAGRAEAEPAEGATPEQAISPRTFLRTFLKGLGWLATARGLSSVATAARYIVFVRLLRPFDFGVIGSATLVCSALSASTNPRLREALIQQKERIDSYLDTYFTTYLFRNLAISIIVIVMARPLGRFFHLGEAYTVFWAISPLPLLVGTQSPRLVSYFRNLDFHYSTILNLSEVAASFAVGLAAVLYWRDWRGLVVSVLAGAIVRLALSYWLFPYRPRLRFDLARAREMLSFGLWFSAGVFSEFVSRQLDNLVIGHVLGPPQLGAYQMAFRAGEMPVAEFTLSTSVVTFSMTARMRKDPRTRWRLFWWVVGLETLVGTGYAIVIWLFGATLVRRICGLAWIDAIYPLKVLCFYGILQGWLVVGRSFLTGLGKPERYVICAGTRAVVLALAIYPLTVHYRMVGAAIAGVIALATAVPVTWLLLRRID
jgi:O-antigen/teichoic acid export membrane protein